MKMSTDKDTLYFLKEEPFWFYFGKNNFRFMKAWHKPCSLLHILIVSEKQEKNEEHLHSWFGDKGKLVNIILDISFFMM